MAEDKITKRAKKKADRAEKKRKKAGAEDLDFESESTLGGKIVTFFVTLVIIVIWLAKYGICTVQLRQICSAVLKMKT